MRENKISLEEVYKEYDIAEISTLGNLLYRNRDKLFFTYEETYDKVCIADISVFEIIKGSDLLDKLKDKSKEKIFINHCLNDIEIIGEYRNTKRDKDGEVFSQEFDIFCAFCNKRWISEALKSRLLSEGIRYIDLNGKELDIEAGTNGYNNHIKFMVDFLSGDVKNTHIFKYTRLPNSETAEKKDRDLFIISDKEIAIDIDNYRFLY